MSQPSRALLIFARRPQPGRVKTRLASRLTPEGAAELYDCMVRDVLARTRALAEVERFLFYEESEGAASFFREIDPGLVVLPQVGDDLGTRLIRAFEEVFAQGCGAAAVIGTDSPDVPLTYMEEAFAALEEDRADVVFGPSEDGGYYAAALRQPCPALFQDIPWSGGEVLERSIRRAGEAGLRVTLLPSWYDVDEPADLLHPRLREQRNGAPLTAAFLRRVLG